MSDQRLGSLLDRLEQVVHKLEKAGSAAPAAAGGAAASASAAAADAPQVVAYDDFYSTYVQAFLDTSRKIGGEIAPMTDLVERGYKALRSVVSVASQAKQPSDADLMQLFQPLVKIMEDSEKLRQTKRGQDSFNHLSTVSESLKALGWPGVPKTPVPYVKEMLDAGQFYATKVLVKYKNTPEKVYVDWVNQHKEMLEQLQAYIKEHHTTGLKWNANGKNWKDVQAGGAATKAAAPAPAPAPAATGAGVPPPPPPGPPPPPPTFDAAPAPSAAAAAGQASMADVFAQLNQGEGVTSRLRKVKDEEKTKNRKDRVAVVTIDESKTAEKESKAVAAAAQAKQEPPKFELQDGKKWIVSNQKNNKEIVIDQTDLKQTVYIFKCSNTLVQVKGKVNTIIVDGCTKTDVVFDDALSSIEFVNCKSCKFQVNGKVPTVNIDKTDGIAVYLSQASIDATIITAKSSEMNVNVPAGEDDFAEHPIPEQFITRYDAKTKKFTTGVNDMNI